MNRKITHALLFSVLVLLSASPLEAQFPQTNQPTVPGIPKPQMPGTPQPATLGPGNVFKHGYTSPATQPNSYRLVLQPGQPSTMHPANPEPDYTVPSNYIDPFKARRDEGRITALESTLRDVYETETRISYDLPAQTTGTAHYRAAYKELSAMLNGTKPDDLKRAVFLVENAWNGNTGSYADFCKSIHQMAADCRYLISRANEQDNETCNMAVFEYLSDTTRVPGKAGLETHFPIRYDFDDFMGKQDWSKMFVTKLVKTGTGQCHSMPLLYLILANEVGAKANLAFGPSHIYVKFPDGRGKLRNLELTNGRLTTDAWIVGSGYVKAEAVRHGIYFDTLTTRQAVALCMFDLAKGYGRKFSMDKFVLDAVNAGLEVHPANVYGLMLKSDFYTLWFAYAHGQAGKPSLQQAKTNHPKLIEIYNQRNRMYDLIDRTGYEDMPDEAYARWLSSVNAAAQVRQDKAIRTELHND